MNDIRNTRYSYLKDWPNPNKGFPIELKYMKKTENFGKQIFYSIGYPYTDEKIDNIVVSYFIEALECMPYKPNHAFEFMFRALDNYSGYFFSVPSNVTLKMKRTAVEISKMIDSDINLKLIIDKLFENMPNSTAQYIYARYFKLYDISRPIGDQKSEATSLFKRTLEISKTGNTNVIGNTNLAEVLEYVAKTYGYDENNYPNSVRKGSRLLYRVFTQNDVEITDVSGISKIINITYQDKIHMMLSGLLYTMRNDSFHGSNIASFKSSNTKLTTYAHNHYSMLCTFIIINLLRSQKISIQSEQQDFYLKVLDNAKINIDTFSEFYKREIK